MKLRCKKHAKLKYLEDQYLYWGYFGENNIWLSNQYRDEYLNLEKNKHFRKKWCIILLINNLFNKEINGN